MKVDRRDGITISELSLLTGLPTSTIRFYLREGLIPPPMRKGKTRAYYCSDHVKLLNRLKKLRDKGKYTISEFKKMHLNSDHKSNPCSKRQFPEFDRKGSIISAAIDLFRSKGYSYTGINDIAERAGISTLTFYKHFPNKSKLFDECVQRIFYDFDNESRELRKDVDSEHRLILLGKYFIKTHRHIIDILNIARGFSIANTSKNAQKLKRIMGILANPFVQDIEDGIKANAFKEMETDVVPHLIMGAMEYINYYCNGKNETEIDRIINTIMGVILKGVNIHLFEMAPHRNRSDNEYNDEYHSRRIKYSSLRSGAILSVTTDRSIKYFRISELARITSFPITTIRFYIKDGVLPPAIKISKTSSLYSDDHLERLLIIKKLQSKRLRSLASIKEELSKIPFKSAPDEGLATLSSEKKSVIIKAAVNIFLTKGLVETSIDDIINKANIGKGTFYKYFKDKNDLFIQCADSIFFEMYSNIWEEIKKEKDRDKRLIKRCIAFFESYPRWIDMMNLVRYSSLGMNQSLHDKFRAVLDQIILPNAHDIEVLQREGRIPWKFDNVILAYIMMGMAEYGAQLIHTRGYSREIILRSIRDLLGSGIKKD